MPPRKPIARDPLPPDVLHDKIKTLRPDMPIKETSIWVAIIHHTADPRDIQFNNLLWIKAHPLITLRTLKYHYYSRNPLEELALQYRREVPDETLSLKDIRPKHARDNVMVFRALDGENVTDAKLRAGIKFNDEQAFTAQGGNPENAIDVDTDTDDDDEPVWQSTQPLNKATSVPNDGLPQNGQSLSTDQRAFGGDAGAAPATQVELNGQNTASQVRPTGLNTAGQLGPTGLSTASDLIDAKVPFKTMTEIAEEPSPPLQSVSPWASGVDFKLSAANTNESPSAKANMAYEEHMSSPPPQPAPASARSNLPEPITPGRETALHTPQTTAVSRTTPGLPPATFPLPAREEYQCAMTMCKARLHPNEWTHYQDGGPLCMGHSAGFYRSRNQMHKVQEVSEWIMRNAREKDFWRLRGYAQSKNEDHLVNKPAAANSSDLDTRSSLASPTERKSYEQGSLPMTEGAGIRGGPGMQSSSGDGDGDGDGDTEAASSDAASSGVSNTDQQHVEQPAPRGTYGQSFVPENLVAGGMAAGGMVAEDMAPEDMVAEDMVDASGMMQGSMVNHQGQMPTSMAGLQTSEEMDQPSGGHASRLGGAGRYSSQETGSPQANHFAHGGSATNPPGWPVDRQHPVTTAMAGPQGEQSFESAPNYQTYWGHNHDQVHMGMASNPGGQLRGQTIGPSPDILQGNPGISNAHQMARSQSIPAFSQQHPMRTSRNNPNINQTMSTMGLSPGHFQTDAGMTNTANDGHMSSFSDVKTVPGRAFPQGMPMNATMGLSPGHFQTGAGVARTVQGPPFYNQRHMDMNMDMGQHNSQNSYEVATPQWMRNQLDTESYQMGANTRGTQRGQASSERWQSVPYHGQSMSASRLAYGQMLQQQAMRNRSLLEQYGGRSGLGMGPPTSQPVSSAQMGWNGFPPYGLPQQAEATSWSQGAGDQRMSLPEFVPEPQFVQGGQMAEYNGELLGGASMQPQQPQQEVGDGAWSYPVDDSGDSGIYGTAHDFSGTPSEQGHQGSEADEVGRGRQQGVMFDEQPDFKQGSGGKRLADMIQEGGSYKKLRKSDEAEDEMYAGLPDDAAAARDDPKDGDYVEMDTSVEGGNDDDDE